MSTVLSVVLTTLVIFLGLLWCREIFRRLPRDIRDLKDPEEKVDRFVIVFYWVITLIILLLLLLFFWGLFIRIMRRWS